MSRTRNDYRTAWERNRAECCAGRHSEGASGEEEVTFATSKELRPESGVFELLSDPA